MYQSIPSLSIPPRAPPPTPSGGFTHSYSPGVRFSPICLCPGIGVLNQRNVRQFIFQKKSNSLRPRLHRHVFKSFRFHFVAFSNRSTLDCVFKCLHFRNRFHCFNRGLCFNSTKSSEQNRCSCSIFM